MLSSLYPDSKALFCGYLGVQNATATTLTHELSNLCISDLEDLHAKMLDRIKSLLFCLGELAEKCEGKLDPAAEEFLKIGSCWPRRYIGSAPVALADVQKPFFIPDHPLLLNLLEKEGGSDFPVLDFQPREIGKVKRLLLALGLEERFLSVSKNETVSATDMSDPADELTSDLRKRAMALF
jgi:hypothetical protein